MGNGELFIWSPMTSLDAVGGLLFVDNEPLERRSRWGLAIPISPPIVPRGMSTWVDSVAGHGHAGNMKAKREWEKGVNGTRKTGLGNASGETVILLKGRLPGESGRLA